MQCLWFWLPAFEHHNVVVDHDNLAKRLSNLAIRMSANCNVVLIHFHHSKTKLRCDSLALKFQTYSYQWDRKNTHISDKQFIVTSRTDKQIYHWYQMSLETTTHQDRTRNEQKHVCCYYWIEVIEICFEFRYSMIGNIPVSIVGERVWQERKLVFPHLSSSSHCSSLPLRFRSKSNRSNYGIAFSMSSLTWTQSDRKRGRNPSVIDGYTSDIFSTNVNRYSKV